MTRHLTLNLLLRVAEQACGTPVQVRDYGLLEFGAHPARRDCVGHDLDTPEVGAFDLVITVADGSWADVEKIAERLAGWSRLR